MQEAMNPRMFLVLIISFVVSPVVLAQGSEKSCRDSMGYENRNQIEYKALLLGGVSGIAVDSDSVAMPQVCLGLFTERDHRLIKTVTTDEQGRFEFHGVASGRYRLVAKYSGFCPANTLLQIKGRKTHRGKTLVIHMELLRPDRCSYGSYG